MSKDHLFYPHNKDPIFVLPNGKPITYGYPWERGKQKNWFKTMLTSTCYNLILGKEDKKTNTIKIDKKNNKINKIKICGFHIKGSQKLIHADFDTLPSGFTNYDQLYLYLALTLRNKAIVTRSNSEKVKATFIVESEKDLEPESALNFLKTALNSDTLFAAIDKKSQAMNTTFVTPHLFYKFRRLSDYKTYPFSNSYSSKQITTERHSTDSLVNTNLPLSSSSLYHLVEEHKYRKVEDEEMIETLRGYHKGDRSKVEFLKILLGSPQLLYEEGFDIPTPKIGFELGISQRSASSIRKFFEKKGLLKCIDKTYIIGKKAYTYIAEKELKQCLQDLKNKFSNNLVKFPKIIQDHHWYETLWKYSYFFRYKPFAFLEYVKSISGIEKKDRMLLASHAIAQRRKYLGFNEDHTIFLEELKRKVYSHAL